MEKAVEKISSKLNSAIRWSSYKAELLAVVMISSFNVLMALSLKKLQNWFKYISLHLYVVTGEINEYLFFSPVTTFSKNEHLQLNIIVFASSGLDFKGF